ncbi:hypothetical protein QP162_10550 [Sphingomonas aurantiaca]
MMGNVSDPASLPIPWLPSSAVAAADGASPTRRVIMLTTPLAALNPNRALAGPRTRLDLLNLFQLDAEQVPVGHSVMIEIDLTTVHQNQQPRIVSLHAAANGNIALTRSPAVHIDASIGLKQPGDITRRRAGDISPRDDDSRCGQFGGTLRLASDTGRDRLTDGLL